MYCHTRMKTPTQFFLLANYISLSNRDLYLMYYLWYRVILVNEIKFDFELEPSCTACCTSIDISAHLYQLTYISSPI